MPHRCTRCGKVYPDASEELLKGCDCGSKFFYYIKQERIEEIKEERDKEVKEIIKQLDKADKEQIEKDIREITGMDEEPEKPVILDLESVKVIKPGKFEIDVINLFNKRRPLIYKLEEGKYIIDLASSFKINKEEVDKKIRDPDLVMDDFKKDDEKEVKETSEEEKTEKDSKKEEDKKEKEDSEEVIDEKGNKKEKETDEPKEKEEEEEDKKEESETEKN